MTSDQLSIMRNEIYARYGYTFRKKGEMDTYFNNQSWYQSQHQNVNSFLTAIERYNIALIKGVE